MLDMLLTVCVCCIVGLLIGWSGIAGFLLPIFFVGYLNMPIMSALAISFFCFLISGVLGSIGYYKKGSLPIKISLVIGCGSFIGSIVGVYLNKLLPSNVVTILLYVVVFCSGISILLRKNKKGPEFSEKKDLNNYIIFALGIVTGAICSFSGAGGPILVMPLLIVLGVNTRSAIGIALFDSIFIALPAIIGYMTKSTIDNLALMLIVCGASHAVGILLGSLSAHKIPQKVLKASVAVFSICISIYKIAAMF